uniref:DUF6705 family protein n=1 Tax=Gelidibacter sp. TaxID=2018083 RepID=UPI004049DE31
MKGIFIILFLFTSHMIFAQQPSTIVEVCSGVTEDEVQDYAYFKDINQTFDKFIGTWKYVNGNEIVIFKITKKTQIYDPEYKIFEDFLVGNYSYSTDGGTTVVVNTIVPFVSDNPNYHPMYSSCAESDKISFIFTDVILNKKSCWIYFEFLPNSLTQMQVRIENPSPVGRLEGQPPYDSNFTLPTEMVVIKQ